MKKIIDKLDVTKPDLKPEEITLLPALKSLADLPRSELIARIEELLRYQTKSTGDCLPYVAALTNYCFAILSSQAGLVPTAIRLLYQNIGHKVNQEQIQTEAESLLRAHRSRIKSDMKIALHSSAEQPNQSKMVTKAVLSS